MTKLKKIAVLAGGISHERDVSLRSGRRVTEALRQQGIEVALIDPDNSLFEQLDAFQPDVVWPTLHGSSGEDGTLADLLNLAGHRFVGSPAPAAQLAWNKSSAKAIVARHGISTPASLTISKEVFRELGASEVLRLVAKNFGTSVVVKPVQGGSAQGVTLVENEEDLTRAMVSAYTYHEVALIEQKITGTEVAVSIIDTGDGPTALPLVEIVPVSGVYSFEARYNAGETEFFVPARLSPEIAAQCAEIAVQAHEAIGLRYVSRVDFIVDEQGKPWFIEVNVLPGLTETSLLPLAAENAGHDLGLLYAALAQSALA